MGFPSEVPSGRPFDASANDDRLHVATISGTGDRAFFVGTDLKPRAQSGQDEHPETGFVGLKERYNLNKRVGIKSDKADDLQGTGCG